MERLARLCNYLFWPGTNNNIHDSMQEDHHEMQEEEDNEHESFLMIERIWRVQVLERRRINTARMEAEQLGRLILQNFKNFMEKILYLFESLLLWENPCWSAFNLFLFSLFYWVFISIGIRAVMAAYSAALALIVCYGCKVCFVEESIPIVRDSPRHNLVSSIIKHFKSSIEILMNMQEEQPGLFIVSLFVNVFIAYIIGSHINNCIVVYVLCMLFLIGPVFIPKCSTGEQTNRDWDSAIEEFLPTVTDDNLEVLELAGESGEVPTPPNSNFHAVNDNLDLDEIQDLKMPSHEDGSIDGLESSELEFSVGETDVDGQRYQKNFFERDSSTSDDEVDLVIKLRNGEHKNQLDVGSDHDSGESDPESTSSSSIDSEFEIIDALEIENIKMV